MGNYKYDLAILEWQQFEKLSYKCLQFDISKSLQFIDGGNDKGRDFVYEGITNFFEISDKSLKYIFQSKHKSLDNFKDLKVDLKRELTKVFITNELRYDVYCLVTNMSLNGNQFDEINMVFSDFINENNIEFNLIFKLYSYNHIESCIDNNESIKYLYPLIIKNADFKLLLEKIINRNESNISNSFILIFEKNKSKFVLTEMYENALSKLDSNNIILLSGPAKSGKTFTAEMIVFNKFSNDDFIPYNIISVEDFDQFYDSSKKQIFLFDDTFGKYNLDYERADYVNRKIEFIFEYIDKNHKCIFTSREYISRAFLDYADDVKKSFITKINIDVNLLITSEKESIFLRYYKLKNNSNDFYHNLDSIVNHINFSPEVIRSYFENNSIFNLIEFQKHISFPNDYLKKIFETLNEEKQIILLSILLSSNQNLKSIAYAYKKISEDLNKSKLLNLENELNLLEDSLIINKDEKYDFYHPTMFEFFVGFINKDILVYRDLLFKNINTNILSKTNFKNYNENNLTVTINDFNNLQIGFQRLIENPNMEINEINSLLRWLNDKDRLINFQLNESTRYKEFILYFSKIISNINIKNIKGKTYHIGLFFKNIKSLNVAKENNFNKDDLKQLILANKTDDKFWYLIFNLLPYLDENIIYDEKYIGSKWLNAFYKDLKNEINSLGNELYGNAFPNFKEVEKHEILNQEKSKEEKQLIKKISKSDFKIKTNKNWYFRYSNCKEKMMIIKTNQPYGNKIYELLVKNYSHLTLLEENQKNRYIFLKQKKWW